ncbi:MAG: DmsC/YnfH family molybdoenzyme membrane anchor subunit [Opitutaceae bacterium]|nr:DmsC/YnfH family molybdoenzyme membrane anchor subunit [Opitutaceae bacterium]
MSATSIESRDKPKTVATAGTLPLLAELLGLQQTLETPVARFARDHEAGTVRTSFRELIPLTVPKPGEQYAFEVDLDRCSGCKACVAGCHSMNGLDDGETWRDVGALVGTTATSAYHQTITSACHHCSDPGCLNGCPVLAYEKDPVTGIVRHLDDQCIGCQYCVLKCPYDVPKYNERLGIVRKCDMCHSRLAVGEAPACVQACPTEAIRIIHVTSNSAATSGRFLAAAPDPGYTKPTTAYVSARQIPDTAEPADKARLLVQPGHLPLVALLVLTQAGLGLMAAAAAIPSRTHAAAGFALYVLGLGASVAHLGQPLRAWRIFLNLRRSWLSREAVLLGAAMPFLAYWVLGFDAPLALSHTVAGTLGFGIAAAGVFSSAMIYVDTQRKAWTPAQTFPRFGGTVGLWYLAFTHPLLAAFGAVAKPGIECLLAQQAPAATRAVLWGPLRSLSLIRLALATGAALVLAFDYPVAGAVLMLAGELSERALYFKSVEPSKMPGVPSA